MGWKKKYWKIPGSSESFDGIPGGYGFENGYPQQHCRMFGIT